MDEAPNICPNLGDQTQFRLKKINEIKDYFIDENHKREVMSKGLSKYIASFDYFNTFLIVLSATSGRLCVASLAIVIGAPVGIASVSFSFAFSATTGIVNKLLKKQQNKKKKHNKIFMLARNS